MKCNPRERAQALHLTNFKVPTTQNRKKGRRFVGRRNYFDKVKEERMVPIFLFSKTRLIITYVYK